MSQLLRTDDTSVISPRIHVIRQFNMGKISTPFTLTNGAIPFMFEMVQKLLPGENIIIYIVIAILYIY